MLHRYNVALLFVALGLLLTILPASGQEFQPGYVLPVGSLDTLRGQVQLQTVRRTGNQCVFRIGPNAAWTTYKPIELWGYGLAPGAHFRRGRLPLNDADTASVLRFEEILVQGPATLLYAADDAGNPRFFLAMSEGKAPVELRVTKRRVEHDGQIFNQTLNLFRQTLLTTFTACPALQSNIRQLAFTELALVNIVRRYNACVATAGTQAVGSSDVVAGPKVLLSFLAGVGFRQQLGLNNDSNFLAYNTTLKAPASVLIGAGLTVLNPRFSRHLRFTFDALWRRSTYTNTVVGTFINPAVTSFDETYSADFLSLPIGVRYDFGHGKLLPFLEIAFSPTLTLAERQNEIISNFNNNSYPAAHEKFLYMYSYTNGGMLGAGVSTHRGAGHDFALRVRYNLQSRVQSYVITDVTY